MEGHFEKTLTSEKVFDGKVVRVYYDTVELENGETSFREVVRHHGGACILPLTDQDEIYLVKQYRYALDREILELPAGKLEAGEDPLAAARRELEEECGLTADRFLDLHPIYPTVGYDDEVIYCYLATGLHPAQMHLDPDEFLTPRKVPFQKAYEMVLDGTIRDAKSVAGILKLYALKQEGKL